MYVEKAERIYIAMNSEEIWQIACDLKYNLLRTAENHWVHHYEQDGTPKGFAQYVRVKDTTRIERIIFFFGVTGRSDVAASLDSELEQIWKNYKQQRAGDSK